MDIKATQLKNVRVEDTSSSIRMAAKVAENGKSFIDEMIDLPKINTENNLKQSSPENKHVEQKFGNDNKSFEFISKSSNSFSSAMNKENMSLQERQAKHKAAEKELVDEIVLMNNKQISQAKEGIKNDLNKAQISVAKKSDEQINEENQEIKNELKSFDIKNQKDESENLRFVSPENIKMTENIEQEIFLPENNQIEEIKGKPEKFENVQLEPLEVFNKPQIADTKELKQEVEQQEVAEKVVIQPQIADVKGVKPEVKQPELAEKVAIQPQIADVKDVKPEVKQQEVAEKVVIQPQIADVKDVKPEVKQQEVAEKVAIQPQIADVKDVKLEVKQPEVAEKVVIQPQIADVKDVKLEVKQPEVAEKVAVQPQIPDVKQSQKISDKFIEQAAKEAKFVENNFEQDFKNNVIQDVKDFEKPEKIEFVENIINNDKIQEKLDKKSEKPVMNKISNIIKPDVVDESEKIGRVKDIAEEVNVKPVDMKPLPPEDIKVIKMEMINPLADLNNSLNTTKTSDIVKFIDANLSTESTKTSKNSTAKKSESSKKSSSEKAIKMTEADAKFFSSLIETNQQVIEGSKSAEQMNNNNILKDVETAHSAQVSKTLLNALKESQENNKPFRLDIDKDISIILRVNKNGAISAEFLPGDEAVEQYLKANIPLLKQKFSDEGLEYDSLSYRQNKKESNEEREKHNRGNKKENGYE